MRSLKTKLLILLVGMLVLPLLSMAQPKDNDPYSRLGFGSLLPIDFVAPSSLGGLGAVYHDQYHLNLSNPAASSFLDYTSFEVAAYARFSSLKNNTGEYEGWGGNLGYMALGFPLQNPLNRLTERKSSPVTWGMSLGLVPNTQVAYNIETVQTVADAEVITNYQGTGGTYRFVWNNSWKYKNISAGVGLGYMFGKIGSEKTDTFVDFFLPYNNRFVEEVSVGGVTWNAGLIYDYIIPKSKEALRKDPRRTKLSVGFYGNTAYKLNTESNLTYLSEEGTFGTAIDTINHVTGLEGTITYPSDFSLGVMYSKDYSWKIGASTKFTKWSDFTEGDQPSQGILNNSTLLDTWRFSLGGEFTPDYRSYNNFLKRIRYRFGTFYSQDARDFNGQLTQYGVSLGFGIPLILQRGLPSFVDIGLEMGRIGNDSDALQQTYGRLTVGFTLNDNSWFIKRKFD